MRPFLLERYFAKYEFAVEHLLSPSDCEPLDMAEVLKMADAEMRELWENLRFSYTESAGHPLLRTEIARLYETISPENVLVCAPEEAIFIAMHIMLRKSEQFFYVAPAYQSLFEIAGTSGCKPHPLTLRAENGRWHLDLDELRRNITRRSRLLVINFPHNPTGFIPSRAEFDALIDIAAEHNLWIFSDEMYRGLEHDPASRLPAICDIYDQGVSLCGMSKSLALPGLRIGWLATRNDALRNNFLMYKDYTTICNSAPSEILSIIALRAKSQILANNRKLIANNLQLAKSFFSEYSEKLEWIEPQGSSTAFPRLRSEIPVDQFAETAVSRQNLMLLPGSVFDFSGNHFRVGLGRTSFPAALNALEKLLIDL